MYLKLLPGYVAHLICNGLIKLPILHVKYLLRAFFLLTLPKIRMLRFVFHGRARGE